MTIMTDTFILVSEITPHNTYTIHYERGFLGAQGQ